MFGIEAILADNILDQNIKTKQVIISQIENKKKLTSIISFLNTHIPLRNYSLTHLKRVNSKANKCFIIIAPLIEILKDTSSEEESIKKVLTKFGDYVTDFFVQNNIINFSTVNVPSTLPLTKFQFDKASLLWPVNFHENKYISKCLTGTIFSDEQLEVIFNLMNEILEQTKASNRSSKCNFMGVLVVKNERKLKVTSMVSDANNPLNHPVMLALDNVARIHCKVKNCEIIPEEMKHYEDDYLCTNYECFLTQDPCLMCAMALVHSRVKRVFIFSDPEIEKCSDCDDASYTRHKLHILENLNHHYEVWKLSPFVDRELSNKRIKL